MNYKSILKVVFAVAVAAVFSIGCWDKSDDGPDNPVIPSDSTITPSPPPPMDDDAIIRDAFVTIYFDNDKTDLRQESINTLGRIANVMREYPDIRVMAEGYADERGTSAYNVALGEGRANVVRDYLVSCGINGERIEITSYGKERPANPNCDGNEECHSKNRRVEWRTLSR